MEISFSSNSITDDHIATKFGTCHDSPAVVPCAKYCSDHFISIWVRAKWNFHHIWIVMEKLLVKWAPEQHTTALGWLKVKAYRKIMQIYSNVGNKVIGSAMNITVFVFRFRFLLKCSVNTDSGVQNGHSETVNKQTLLYDNELHSTNQHLPDNHIHRNKTIKHWLDNHKKPGPGRIFVITSQAVTVTSQER